jgi:hypothetical protein
MLCHTLLHGKLRVLSAACSDGIESVHKHSLVTVGGGVFPAVAVHQYFFLYLPALGFSLRTCLLQGPEAREHAGARRWPHRLE